MIEQLDGVKETVHYDRNGSVRFYHNVEDEAYPLHWHGACEVIMPLRGGYTVICQNQEIRLKQGDILWIAAGVLHRILTPEERGERMILLYDPRFINEFNEFSAIGLLAAPAAHISPEETPEMHRLLQDLLLSTLRTEIAGGHFKNVAIYAELIKFHAAIFDALVHDQTAKAKLVIGESGEEDQSWNSTHMSVVYSSCEFIRNNCRENLTLEQAAEFSGFSKFYFSRMFKYYTQMSFLEYLNRCRISEAERLLADPEITVTQAALDSGFNSISTFNRVFKLTKNCTPAEFQKLAHCGQVCPTEHGTAKFVERLA